MLTCGVEREIDMASRWNCTECGEFEFVVGGVCGKCRQVTPKKTREEVEALKENWLADSCYDLENVEGFEEYRDELTEYSNQMKAYWRQKNLHCNVCAAKIKDGETCAPCQKMTHFERLLIVTLRSLDGRLADVSSATTTYEKVQNWR